MTERKKNRIYRTVLGRDDDFVVAVILAALEGAKDRVRQDAQTDSKMPGLEDGDQGGEAKSPNFIIYKSPGLPRREWRSLELRFYLTRM